MSRPGVEPHIVDTASLADETPFSGLRRMMFGLCFCVALLDGFDTAAIGHVTPSLVAEWGLTRPSLAPLSSAALFGLAVGDLALAVKILTDARGPARPSAAVASTP